MTEHTKGPWELLWYGGEKYPFPLSIHTEDGEKWIARSGTVSSKANARLIAAAPDLLEALEAANAEMACIDEDAVCDHDANICWCGWHHARDAMRAAIEKAKP